MMYVVWPYLKNQGIWTIPDPIMLAAWKKMDELDRIKPTWYDASIVTQEDFIRFMQGPYIFPSLVVEDSEPKFRMLAWLSDLNEGVARVHFCYLDRYDPDVARTAINFWKKIGTIRVLIGTTPESYKTVLKIVEKLGFTILGTIPDACNMVYLNRREGGVISYYQLKGE